MIHDEDENKNRRKTWNWIKKREQYGANLVQELRAEDTNAYKEMMGMEFDSFGEILRYLEPYISPRECFCGTKIILAQERLVLTIRFLATGETFRSLSYQFRISERTISYIIEQVTKAIAHYVILLLLFYFIGKTSAKHVNKM